MSQGLNAVKATAKTALSGFKTVDQSEQSRRLDICRSNKCGKFTGTRCAECGCVTRWKAKLETENCPLGMWDKKENQDGSNEL